MRERCSVCGRFCVPADVSCPFGGSGDIDPPEEDWYCKQCVRKETEYHISHGWLPSNRRKAKWEYVVAEKLGFILVSVEGAAWSVWHKKTSPLPKGWVKEMN